MILTEALTPVKNFFSFESLDYISIELFEINDSIFYEAEKIWFAIHLTDC